MLGQSHTQDILRPARRRGHDPLMRVCCRHEHCAAELRLFCIVTKFSLGCSIKHFGSTVLPLKPLL